MIKGRFLARSLPFFAFKGGITITNKKEQRIGQIIMACNIIKSENERMATLPKVTVQDLMKWMKADIEYVRKLVGICASLDKRNITDNILISDKMQFMFEDVDALKLEN